MERGLSRRLEEVKLTVRFRQNGRICERPMSIEPSHIAIVIIDLWDQHWCRSATERLDQLATALNPFLDVAREAGMRVIHAPDCDIGRLETYREPLKHLPSYELPVAIPWRPPLPPGARTATCECDWMRSCYLKRFPDFERDVENYQRLAGQRKAFGAYIKAKGYRKVDHQKKVHPKLQFQENDVVIQNVKELYGLVQHHSIYALWYTGMASNRCVSWSKPYSMLGMKRLGVETYFVRDMVKGITGNGFNPDTNEVDLSWTPEVGDQKIVAHLEAYFGPSLDSSQIVTSSRFGQIGRDSLLPIPRR